MELDNYQKEAMTTCMESCYNLEYMLLNLQGEVGELSSKFAKAIRKEKIDFTNHGLVTYDKSFKDEIILEAGDILWQLQGVLSVMDISLDEVAQRNLQKLASRKQRNVIDGNGDYR